MSERRVKAPRRTPAPGEAIHNVPKLPAKLLKAATESVDANRVEALLVWISVSAILDKCVDGCSWMHESTLSGMWVKGVSQAQLFRNADLQVRRRRVLCPGRRVWLSPCPR